jgi:CO/xanthine dehydrogenase FAD-binding subunit
MFCGDIAPALIASGASVILKSKEGERRLPVEDFYTGDGKEPLNLGPGEFLSHVVVQKDPSRKEVYLKLTARQTGGFSVVGVAASLHRVDGYCHDPKIAVTSVCPKPIRLKEAERSLEGKRFENPALEDAARFAYEEVHPVAFMGVGAAYRRKMVGVMVKKALGLLSGGP